MPNFIPQRSRPHFTSIVPTTVLVPCQPFSCEETFSGETKKPRRCEKPRLVLEALRVRARTSLRAEAGARAERKVTTPHRPRAMGKKRCSHGREKYKCVQCTPCPHGKVKYYCAACNTCAHGKLKSDCAACNALRAHGKVKRILRGLQPVRARQAETDCAGLQAPLPAWQAGVLRGLQPLPAWQAAGRLVVAGNRCPHGKVKRKCQLRGRSRWSAGFASEAQARPRDQAQG